MLNILSDAYFLILRKKNNRGYLGCARVWKIRPMSNKVNGDQYLLDQTKGQKRDQETSRLGDKVAKIVPIRHEKG